MLEVDEKFELEGGIRQSKILVAGGLGGGCWLCADHHYMSSIISCEGKTFHCTKNVMASNIDLKMEIRAILKKIKRWVKMTNVQAHQDEEIAYEDLPLSARLNTDMDNLTNHQYNHPISDHRKLMPHLPEQKISPVVHGNRLSHNMS